MAREKKSAQKLILIDGHAMAYRAHFAFAGQQLTDSAGNPTETTFGFYRMLARLIADRKPTHLVICFDPGREHNPRYEIYPQYKANRPPMPDTLRRQIEEIQKLAEKLHLPPLIVEGAEADDVIATLVEKYRDQFDQVEIVSGDKDLYHMLYKNVVMLRSKKGVTDFNAIDAEWLKKELGIKREQVPDFMALVGDTTDNIPGVAGVGEKTAAKLIAEYKSLAGIYKNLPKIKPESLREKLAAAQKEAEISLQLATLRKDVEIPRRLEEMQLALKPEQVQVFRNYGFATVAKEWEKLLPDGEVVMTESPKAGKHHFCQNMQIVKSEAELRTLLQKLEHTKEVAVDTETTGLAVHESALVGISFAWQENGTIHSAYVVLCGNSALNPDYSDADDPARLLPLLKVFLENPKIRKIGQNIKFDLQVLRHVGIHVANYTDDTMLISFLLNPNSRRHSLDALAEDVLHYQTISYEELTGKGKNKLPITAVPLAKLSHYACEDAEVALALREALYPKLDAPLRELYHEVDVPLAEVLAEMEYTGIAIDVGHLHQLAREYRAKIAAAEKEVFRHAGEEFNIASTKQLQQILFEKLRIPSERKTEKGALSTDQSVLEELRGAHPIIEPILQYRFYTKLLSTYAEALPHYVSKATGRIHTSLSQVSAATARLASLEPNLQNIPIKGEEGAQLRAAFVAEKGKTLLSLDYSQIELRILAHYCGDENLIAAYRNDQDIHDRAAYMLFRSRFDPERRDFSSPQRGVVLEVNPEELALMKASPGFSDLRSQAKVLNFSIVYGVTEFGLARNLGISRREAKELMESYFTAFPGIRRYMQEAVAEAKKKGYAENLFGRRRPIADLDHKIRYVREAAERLAINTPIQSTAADLIKKAMIRIAAEIHQRKLRSRMLLQIHDELLFEVEPGEEEELEKLARSAMENAAALRVPLRVDGGFGQNWNACKA